MRYLLNARKGLRTIWLVAILVFAGILLAPKDSAVMTALDTLSINDKFGHFGACAVLVLLPAIHERRRVIVAVAIGTLILGIGLEYNQLFSLLRLFELGDVVANVAGICFGLLVGFTVRSRAN